MIKFDSPIIIIGAGRSGSTLLGHALNAHPDIIMIGETRLMTNSLWKDFHRWRAYATYSEDFILAHRARHAQKGDQSFGAAIFEALKSWKLTSPFVAYLGKITGSAATKEDHKKNDLKEDNMGIQEEWRAEEKKRLGAVILNTIVDVFALREREDKKYWGMQETWVGGDVKEVVDWSIYDYAYPEALWVHIIRNPFDYAKSAIVRNNIEFTPATIYNQLLVWERTIRKSRQRSNADRWVEIKYEDLVSNPQEHMRKILEKLGLTWSDSCLAPFTVYWGSTPKQVKLPEGEDFAAALKTRDSLRKCHQLMLELGYDPPQTGAVMGTVFTSKQAEVDAHGRIILKPPFLPDPNYPWRFDFFVHPELEIAQTIMSCADKNTPFEIELFENGIPLVREDTEGGVGRGPGVYSIWRTNLCFATKDGSDPNTNSRTYSITFNVTQCSKIETAVREPTGDRIRQTVAIMESSQVLEAYETSLDIKSEIIAKEDGFCYYYPLPELFAESNNMKDAERSVWMLKENGVYLPFPHSLHQSIRKTGMGRYSHWREFLYFSTSDNTDPRANGRKYVFVKPLKS